ncbi:DUF742 domain-containing protein [Longispora albida]|uniref:DUF742 domain-containing protein n=1 Tax=Longispora albida TaxID=203523 RepID=UPI00035EA77D|nr:DUF742 domain-containing protein [Longispora albida]
MTEWLDEEAGPVVRPYAMTRGRTRPVGGDFDLIAIVMATGSASEAGAGAGLEPEHVAILDLCRRPLSVAEISAHLDLPVGIVRVLLGDLQTSGLVLTRAPQPAMEQPSKRVLLAVIDGLRAL